MKTLTRSLRALQRRIGPREEWIAGVVLGLIGAGGFAFTLTTHVGTPAGAALAYVAATDRGDTDYVWSHSIIDGGTASAASSKLLDRHALEAQLKATEHSRSGFSVLGVHYVSKGTAVTLAYDTAAWHHTTQLVMQGGAPHSWPVLVQPAGLALNLPSGVGTVLLDGRPLTLDGTQSKMALFPGIHTLTVGEPSVVFQPFTELIDVDTTFPTLTSPTFTVLKLTDNAAQAAKQTVAKAIQDCIGRSDLKPSGCPQSYTSDLANGAATWTLLGDPTAQATTGVGPNGVEVRGHYLMKVAYTSVSHGPRTIAVGGPFRAILTWDGAAFKVSGFGDAASVPVQGRPPAASDAEVLSALQTQFTTCLKLQAGSDPSCPQSVAAYYASNFVWHANSSDPTQGVSIVWNGAQGFFQASGSFDFSVDYDSTPPYSPTRHYQDHSSGQYVADFYWDGKQAVFVGFEK
jgi:hypothetical protein